MAHFYPTINRYEKPDRRGEIATKSLSEDGFLEDPIATTVPIGWKGKCSSKREYSKSTQNEEFWKAFDFGDNGPEPAKDQTASLGTGHQRNNRLNQSEGQDGRISGATPRDMESLGSDFLPDPQSSVDALRAYHVQKEQQLRTRIQSAIEKMPEDRRSTLELCEVNRQQQWNAWLAGVLKSNLKSKEISQPSITGAQSQFPVEFPVGRAIDEQNNEAVNLRLYTECVKYGGVRNDTRAPPELPDDVKALIALLNQSLPSAVEIGGASTVSPDEGDRPQFSVLYNRNPMIQDRKNTHGAMHTNRIYREAPFHPLDSTSGPSQDAQKRHSHKVTSLAKRRLNGHPRIEKPFRDTSSSSAVSNSKGGMTKSCDKHQVLLQPSFPHPNLLNNSDGEGSSSTTLGSSYIEPNGLQMSGARQSSSSSSLEIEQQSSEAIMHRDESPAPTYIYKPVPTSKQSRWRRFLSK